MKTRKEFNEAAQISETVVGFKNTQDNELFVNTYSDPEYEFDDNYLFKSSFSSKNADEITSLKENDIYGPYKDDLSYKLTKMLSVKNIPDSAKVRHILIPHIGALKADETVFMTKEQAKFRADSIYNIT